MNKMTDKKEAWKLKGCMLSNKQDWKTPVKLYKKLDEEFNFDFDPCPINPSFDGLSIEWGKINFVNPPYNESAKWIEKGFNEYRKGKVVVFLLPARTDTKAFHNFIYPYAKLRFIKGRLKFDDGKSPAPFPSMICILRGDIKEWKYERKRFKVEDRDINDTQSVKTVLSGGDTVEKSKQKTQEGSCDLMPSVSPSKQDDEVRE